MEWTIHIHDIKNSDLKIPNNLRYNDLIQNILQHHCDRCHLYVDKNGEHSDEECALRVVMNS